MNLVMDRDWDQSKGRRSGRRLPIVFSIKIQNIFKQLRAAPKGKAFFHTDFMSSRINGKQTTCECSKSNVDTHAPNQYPRKELRFNTLSQF